MRRLNDASRMTLEQETTVGFQFANGAQAEALAKDGQLQRLCDNSTNCVQSGSLERWIAFGPQSTSLMAADSVVFTHN